MSEVKYKKTAARLCEIINERGLKPQELADKSGVAKASISQYRNGSNKPSNISAPKMANVLDCNPMWLMGFDVDKYNTKNENNYKIDDSEKILLEAFRSADSLTQAMVYRALGIEEQINDKKPPTGADDPLK